MDHHGRPWTVIPQPKKRKVGSSILTVSISSDRKQGHTRAVMKTRRRRSRLAAPRPSTTRRPGRRGRTGSGQRDCEASCPSGRVDLDHGDDHIRPRRDNLGDREPELRAPGAHGRHPPQIVFRVGLVDAALPVGDERAQVTGEERAHPLRVGLTERLDQLARDAFGALRRRHRPSLAALPGMRAWPGPKSALVSFVVSFG